MSNQFNSTRSQWKPLLLLIGFAIGSLFSMQMTTTVHGAPTPQEAITEFPVPFTQFIATDTHGKVWFTEAGYYSHIGRMTSEGFITEFPVPSTERYPSKIILGPDGNIWYLNRNFNLISRVTHKGVITEFGTGVNGQLLDITAGQDGNLWFTIGLGPNRIGRMTPEGIVTLFPLPNRQSGLYNISSDAYGNLWFTERSLNQIGRITLEGNITEFPVSSVKDITTGWDGSMWFTQQDSTKIGSINQDGVVKEFSVPNVSAIASNKKGTLWFAEQGNTLGRMSQRGKITEFPIQSPALDIAPGNNDNSIWFINEGGLQIGHLQL